MRLTIIEPYDSCGQMRQSIESLLGDISVDQPELIRCPPDKASLSKAIIGALDTTDFVLVVGGMSPKGHARSAAAAALAQPLLFSQKAASLLEQRCATQQLDFSEYACCCQLPQGAKAMFGQGTVPACLCAADDRAVLLLDDKADELLLTRLKSLLISLFQVEAGQTERVPKHTSSAVAAPKGKKSHSSSTHSKKKLKEALIGCAAISGVLLMMVLLGFSGALTQKPHDEPIETASVPAVLPSAGPVWQEPYWNSSSSSEEPDEPDESIPAASSSTEAASSVSSASSAVSSSQSSSQAASSLPVSQSPVESSAPAASSQPVSSSSIVSSSQPVPETPVSSSSEPDMVYVYNGEDDDIEEEEDEEYDEPSRSEHSGNTPSAHQDAFSENLSYTYNGKVYKSNAYDLVCQIMQNETRGNLAPEALKAHVVATYSMIKYNNAQGIAPSVLLNSDISSAVENAVDAVLGVGIYYNGSYANTVYHSTSAGSTTSSQAVWGGALPYLVSVKSSYDSKSPYYQSSYTISEDDFARRVEKVYGITLDGDPDDWIIAERDAPGGYVGTVTVGGKSRSQGGTAGTAVINGRSIREKLFSFALRSHCFEVTYNASKERFEFTVYGYGHGVGMSQYGAHFMALDGYSYVEILEHYYKGTDIY